MGQQEQASWLGLRGPLSLFAHLPDPSIFQEMLAKTQTPGPQPWKFRPCRSRLWPGHQLPALPHDSEAPQTPQGRGPHNSTADGSHPSHCLDSRARNEVFESREGL